jgi:hypothetical protein
MNFATLTVVQDFTVVIAGAGLLIVGAVVYVIMQRRGGEMELE